MIDSPNKTLDVADILQTAKVITGLDDFGPEAFEPSLKQLLQSFKDEASLTPSGQEILRDRLVKSLTDRLQIQAALTANPEILEQPVNPVIITGLNRTGTTKLHRLMGTDPMFRVLPLWEAFYPVPLDGETNGDNSLRIAATKAAVDAFKTALPQAHAGHPIFATVADEECYCTQMEMQWTSWFGYAHCPSYMQWVTHASMRDAYIWFRKTLQYMQWKNGGTNKRWLLKAPFHLGFLDDLAQVFPEAAIIQCHRTPLIDPIASISQLIFYGRRISSNSGDALTQGPEVCGYLAAKMKKHFEQRKTFKNPLIDVDYRDTFEHSEQLLASIYRQLGIPFGEQQLQRIRQWEQNNAQHTHGKFQYSAVTCGLDNEMVNQAFGEYTQWLDNFMCQRQKIT